MDIRSILGGVSAAPSKTTQQADNKVNAERKEADTSSIRTNEEKVTLTDTAGRLQKAQTTAATQPEVDSARVEQLRKALADGTYKVSADRVAARLMAFEVALKGR